MTAPEARELLASCKRQRDVWRIAGMPPSPEAVARVERDEAAARECLAGGVAPWLVPGLITPTQREAAQTIGDALNAILASAPGSVASRMAEHVVAEHAARVAAEAEADGLRRDLAAVAAERDAVKARAREAAQTIIAAIGADGPQNVEEAAERIVARLRHSEAARDEAEHIAARLVKACECVTCRGSILPPMQCGYCIEREEPTKGMPQRPATTNLRERAQRAEVERDLYRAALADAARGEAPCCDSCHGCILATRAHPDGGYACESSVCYAGDECSDTPHAAAIRGALKATEGER